MHQQRITGQKAQAVTISWESPQPEANSALSRTFLNQVSSIATGLCTGRVAWLRAQADEHGECVSVFLRDLVMVAYIAQQDDHKGARDDLDNIRETVFVSVALDALRACPNRIARSGKRPMMRMPGACSVWVLHQPL